MPNRNRFSRFALLLTLLMTFCAGVFSPRMDVGAKPLRAVDELNVFISEFRTRGPNGADDEFIEIFNASGGSIALNGWKIRKSSGCGTTLTDLATIGAVNIAPGQYYLVAKSGTYSGFVTPDLTYTTAGVADDGGLALVDASARVIDQAGLCVDTTYKEGTALSALNATVNQSYERKSGGSAGSCKDTDNNSADFILNSATSNPQNFSSAAVPCLAVVNATSSIVSPITFVDTSAAIIDIQLTFNNIVTVTGVPTLLIETGATDRTAKYASGSGTNVLTFNYTVGAGDSTTDLDYASVNALSLNGGTIVGASGDAVLLLPKPGAPGSLSSNEDIRIDTVSAGPALLSLTRQTPASQFTNADELVFRATFNKAVLNVDASDFIKVSTTTATITTITKLENGRIYDLKVSGGNLASFNGTVSLDLSGAQNIVDVGGVALSNIQPATDEQYDLDNTIPTVTINQAGTQIDPANTLPVIFSVIFSEPIDATTFTAADIRQNGTALGVTWNLTNSGDNQNFTLSAVASSAGTLISSLNAGTDSSVVIKDRAGNHNAASTSADNNVTFIDNIPPTVTINQPGTQSDPTSALPINFTVQFSEPINAATFASADITQTGTAVSVVCSITNSGANQIFTLAATSSGYGTLVPSIAANRVTDLSGNNNSASTSADNSVTFSASSARSIIINEVAWSGTTSSLTDDEWIELYNTTNASINITGWTLKSADGTPAITLNGTIAAGAYFLLERDNDNTVSDVLADQIYTGDLSNSGEALSLLDGANTVIDTANGNGGAWPKGSSSTYESMERTGASAESDSAWHTNTSAKRNGKNANGGDILGTPKSSNSPVAAATATTTSAPTATSAPASLVVEPRPIINEILARPGFDWNQDGATDVFDEFIEIKNLTAVDISLSGWKLDKLGSTSFSLPSGTLKPGERIIYYSKQTNLLLSDGGETVRLINSNGKIYDAFTYDFARTEDRSFCRLPDGNPGNAWFEDCTPTPNLSNTREGSAPNSVNGSPSPVCNLPDTIPFEFFLPECNGYGADIWSPSYWDQLTAGFKTWITDKSSKWDTFIE
ncbi:MAG: lamin tail domain-containing protein [Anaerolineales bacterium]|uniref:lamin tail domain-containing protein n=1 Tax=Candidatus Villigracilis vicinus TaxID=3140679 RepID=UPI0031362BA9|nr:lamin tail domain-containing protein [Anaerolineales bacterium]